MFPPGVGEDLVPHDGSLLRGHPHPGHGPLEAPPLGFAGVALIGHPQGLGEPLGPPGRRLLERMNRVIPAASRGGLPGPDLVVGFGHPVGDQGVVQVGQQELTPLARRRARSMA